MPGQFGAQAGSSFMMGSGGGFGGFTVSLIEKKYYDKWYNKMLGFYSKNKFLKFKD